MKKLFSFLSALVISCLMVVNVFAADLKIDNINVNSDNITFSVVLSELPNEINAIHGLQIRHTYDADVLDYKSGMSTLLNKSGLEMTAKDGNGTVVWLDMNVADEANSNKVTAEMLEKANGVLFNLEFTKIDSVARETQITIDYVEITERVNVGEYETIKTDDLTVTNGVIDFCTQEKEAARVVIELIDAIGDVTLDSINEIEAAEKAYENLTDIQKKYVTNYDVLERARAEYNYLKAEADDTKIVICDKTYDNDRIKVIVVKNIPVNKVVSIGGKEAAMITNSDGSAHYYVTIDKELDSGFNSDELGYDDIVIKEPVNEEEITNLVIGDIDSNGQVTLEDVSVILEKTAELDGVDKFYVNPFAYIASDIIGDGHITAADAFVALGIVANNPNAKKWVKPIGIEK